MLPILSSSLPRNQRGFTLIEIMVVVIIIGTMVALIGVRINRDTDRLARLEAKRFIAVVNEVRDESILTGRVFALQFDEFDKSYQFYSNPENWTLMEGERLFKKRQMPEGVEIEVSIEEIQNEDDNEEGDEDSELLAGIGDEADTEESTEAKPSSLVLKNYALISPVGDMTPFSLILSGDEYRYQLSLNDEQVFVTERLD